MSELRLDDRDYYDGYIVKYLPDDLAAERTKRLYWEREISSITGEVEMKDWLDIESANTFLELLGDAAI